MAVLTQITSRSLADNSVTSAKVQGDVIAAGDLAPNSVTASELADDAVDTAAIADDAVTNASIADGAIDTAAKLGSNVVTTAKIADSTGAADGITTAKLATNAVTTAKITDANITTAKVADNAVTTAKVATATFTDNIEVKPHIIPGVLYPAYNGKLLNGENHSGAYGTAQTQSGGDGNSYYYTAIQGRGPIKDPRIGAHFGSQRHLFTSLQKNEQCSGANNNRLVYNVDGRDNIFAMYPSGLSSTQNITYNAYGHHLVLEHSNLTTAGDLKIEITGYFNSCNLLFIGNTDHNDLRVRIDGGSYVVNQLDNNRSNYSSPKITPNFANSFESYVINHGSAITTPGLYTLTIENNAANRHIDIAGVELYAQDTTSTANKSKLQIPAQSVVSYNKKFALSAATPHYDPFNGFTSGNLAAVQALGIDTATSLGLSKWLLSSTYYKPFHGGRVVKWIANDGTIKTSVTIMPPNAKSIADSASPTGAATTRTTSTHYGTNTYNLSFEVHTVDPNEDQLHEIAKQFHVREFGNGSANSGPNVDNFYLDVTTLTSTSRNVAHVMEDGATSFGGDSLRNSNDRYGIGLTGDDSNDTLLHGFIGTGVAVTTPNGTESGIYAQNLPYGSHIVRVKNGKDSGAGMADIHLEIDGIRILSDADVGYHQWEYITIYQPKMPPIPKDACIIADYMLMADFVATPSTWSGTHYGIMRSKGVRAISAYKDLNYVDGDGDNFSFDKQIRACVGQIHSIAGGTADSDTSLKTRLPVFATNVQVRGHNMDSKTKYFKDDVEQTATDFAGDNSGSHMTTPLELGHHFLGTNVISGQTQNIAEFEVATPIHTSHHYQAWETPFLLDLLGGDRNIEQTNLICSSDGKTWDETYRNTSYLSSNIRLQTTTDTGYAGSTAIIWDEWRGALIDPRFNFNKGWAIAYDTVICLEDGMYEIYGQCISNSNAAGATMSVLLNGTNVQQSHFGSGGSHENASNKVVLYCTRGDAVQIHGVSHANDHYTNFTIKKLS